MLKFVNICIVSLTHISWLWTGHMTYRGWVWSPETGPCKTEEIKYAACLLGSLLKEQFTQKTKQVNISYSLIKSVQPSPTHRPDGAVSIRLEVTGTIKSAHLFALLHLSMGSWGVGGTGVYPS